MRSCGDGNATKLGDAHLRSQEAAARRTLHDGFDRFYRCVQKNRQGRQHRHLRGEFPPHRLPDRYDRPA
jgi:hypothetical protein